MKTTVHIEPKKPQYSVVTGLSFAQVDDWCGHSVRDLKMDVIYPEQGDKKSPCIVWICGGGWLTMSVSAHLLYLCELAHKGFVVASVQYRTSNHAPFPAQLEDVKAGIRYLKAHADRFCIDPDRFGVMGESAGGQLAAMAALTGDRKEFDKGEYLEYSSAVQAACPWYVPSVLGEMVTRYPQEMQAGTPESLLIGGNAAVRKEEAAFASPINYVTEQAPPFLLLHGTCDRTVPFALGERLYEALEEKGADAKLIAIEGADHADVHFFQEEIWNRIETFFKEKLGKEEEKDR